MLDYPVCSRIDEVVKTLRTCASIFVLKRMKMLTLTEKIAALKNCLEDYRRFLC